LHFVDIDSPRTSPPAQWHLAYLEGDLALKLRRIEDCGPSLTETS
jgi:hypothetical protein